MNSEIRELLELIYRHSVTRTPSHFRCLLCEMETDARYAVDHRRWCPMKDIQAHLAAQEPAKPAEQPTYHCGRCGAPMNGPPDIMGHQDGSACKDLVQKQPAAQALPPELPRGVAWTSHEDVTPQQHGGMEGRLMWERDRALHFWDAERKARVEAEQALQNHDCMVETTGFRLENDRQWRAKLDFAKKDAEQSRHDAEIAVKEMAKWATRADALADDLKDAEGHIANQADVIISLTRGRDAMVESQVRAMLEQAQVDGLDLSRAKPKPAQERCDGSPGKPGLTPWKGHRTGIGAERGPCTGCPTCASSPGKEPIPADTLLFEATNLVKLLFHAFGGNATPMGCQCAYPHSPHTERCLALQAASIFLSTRVPK